MDAFHRSFERLFAMESFIQDELKSHDVLSSLICGSVAGMVAKTAIAPAERVKMSFQISSDKFGYPAAYRRAVAMIKADGITGLWKGGSTTLLRVAPFAGISYATHDYAEKAMKKYFGVTQLTFGWKFLAGSLSGAAGTVSTYPLDVLRVRLALTKGLTWKAALQQGHFYQGLLPTLLGIIPYSGTAWCVKQTIGELFPTIFARKQTTTKLLVSNAFAGLVGQFVTYPLDVVRRRMQMTVLDTQNRISLRQLMTKLFKEEGIRGLFKGFSLNIIKGPITLSLSLTTYDLMRDWISKEWSWRDYWDGDPHPNPKHGRHSHEKDIKPDRNNSTVDSQKSKPVLAADGSSASVTSSGIPAAAKTSGKQ